MSKVAVIGAGAAGVVAALKASERHNVILLEGNEKCGKKLLLTGNGRCNYWNSDISVSAYETDCPESLESILKNKDEVFFYLEKIGLYPKIKNGYYYPYSNQASSVREIFEKKVKSSKIEFATNFKVTDILEKNGKYILLSENEKAVECDKLIIATGSKAYPKTGSDGSGYKLAKALGHNVNEVLPALCGLVCEGKFLKEWEKIRCDAAVSLYVNGECIKTDIGEIQLTNNGISGICTFNISGQAAENLYLKNKVEVMIDFMPELKDSFYNWFSERCALMGNVTVEQALESVFNYKLMFVLLKQAGIDKTSNWWSLSEKDKSALCKAIKEFKLKVCETESYDKCQVCTGGVPLSEINSETMESLEKDNVYFAGEIIDVDGRCGGYNLAFAFISGYIAGGSV